MKKYSLLQKIKIILSRTLGYSWCLHCSQTWDKVDRLSIPFEVKLPEVGGSGHFPVCERCFDELGIPQILVYFIEGSSRWNFLVDFEIVIHNIKYLKAERNRIRNVIKGCGGMKPCKE